MTQELTKEEKLSLCNAMLSFLYTPKEELSELTKYGINVYEAGLCIYAEQLNIIPTSFISSFALIFPELYDELYKRKIERMALLNLESESIQYAWKRNARQPRIDFLETFKKQFE